DLIAHGELPKRGHVERVGNQIDLEVAPANGIHREAHAIDADRAFARQVMRELRWQAKTQLLRARLGAAPDQPRKPVDVPGDQVPAQRIAGAQCRLQVDASAELPCPSVVRARVSSDTSTSK